MYNELIIGLGGCGGKSIQAFRRTAELRVDDYKAIQEKGTRIDYLYIDSNDDILNKAGWSVFGKSIKLEASQVIELKQTGVPDIDLVSDRYNIKPWIGDIKDSYSKRSSQLSDNDVKNALQNMTGAGQLRRYGRVLFALNAAQVRSTLAKKIEKLISGRKREVTFRIFCTLGGGTGSGSLLDMVTLIQTECAKRQVKAIVLVYAYVAGEAASAADAGSFYENEYCSLRDLNALIVGKYKPLVTCAQFEDPRDAEYSLSESITRVFISSEVTEGSPKIDAQVEHITSACFDSIVYAHCYTDEKCLKAISDEDLAQNTPGESAAKGREIVRSYRFGALGSRRWRVPTTQIRELLNRDIEVRVWNALLNGNKLPEGISRDITRLEDFSCDFSGTKTSEVYDKLEKELTSPIRELYDNMISQKRRDANVLRDLYQKAEEQLLVVKKLPNEQQAKLDFIEANKAAVALIERNFVAKADEAIRWGAKADVWGLNNVKKYLEGLRTAVSKWDVTNVPQSKPDEIQNIHEGILKKMEAREKEWEKLGFLTISLTKLDERMMAAQCEDACNLIINAAKTYKKPVIKELVKKIDEMLRKVEASLDAFIARVVGARDVASNYVNIIYAELKAHAGNSSNGMNDMYAFDDANLKAVRAAMEEQVSTLEGDMAYYSNALKQAVGEDASVILCSDTAYDDFKLEMDTQLLNDTTTKIHNEACRAAAKPSVLVGNIIERLSQVGGKIPSNWEMKLGELVSSFMSSIQVSADIEPRDGLQKPQASPCAAIVIGLPDVDEYPELRKWLEDKLMSSKPNTFHVMNSEFYKHSSKEEIRVLYIPYWMPCRFAKVTDILEKKYKQTLNDKDESKVAKIYFANYDATGEDGRKEFSRPALTKGSEPDEENELKTKALSDLYVKIKGVARPIVKYTGNNISFADKVDKLEGVMYTASYADTQIKFPGSSYKSDLTKAVRLAVRPSAEPSLYESMTEDEKVAVFNKYQKLVDEAEANEGLGSPEYEQAVYVRKLMREMLEL